MHLFQHTVLMAQAQIYQEQTPSAKQLVELLKLLQYLASKEEQESLQLQTKLVD